MDTHETGAAVGGTAREPDGPLFSHLLASKPTREGRSAFAATLTSVIGHGVVIALLVWATMAVGQEVAQKEAINVLIPVEEAPPPPPPPPPPPVEVKPPPIPEAPVAKGFQTLAAPDIVLSEIPPPKVGPIIKAEDYTGVGVEGGIASGDSTIKTVTEEDITAAPRFTPFTLRPELKNRDEIARALQRNYPPLLRDAGIGGAVLVWILIDETGKVMKTTLKEGSGYDAMDQAALKVADIMKFSPAQNRDKRVKVWVSLPITFTSQ